jgi:hypothetical protein
VPSDLDTAAVPAQFEGLAAAVRRYLSPPTECLLGIRQLTPTRDGLPPTGEPCPHCGGIYDAQGKALWARVVYPASGLHLTRPTGIRDGDSLACPVCDGLSPGMARRARYHAKPSRPPADSKPTRTPRLTAKERKSLAREPRGRCWLAMLDLEEAARATGDEQTWYAAMTLQTLLYQLDDGLIDLAELGRRTDEVLAELRPAAVSA